MTKRYMVPVTAQQKELAVRIADDATKLTGWTITYTTVLRQSLERGLKQMAQEKNISTTLLTDTV